MQRFDNVDVFASLNALMRQNTGFYQSDLEIDKEIIARAAASPDAADKRFSGSPARRGRIASRSATFS